MKKLLQMDFSYSGPFGEKMSTAMKELAESIAREPGLIWKIWTENAEAGEAGGIYLFEDEVTARAYLSMHSERLRGMGITHINCKMFDVNEALTAIDRGSV